MKYYFYAYLNRKLVEFLNPFSNDTPPDVLAAALKRSILLKPEEAQKQNLDECRLFVLGEFEPVKGVITVYPEKQEILDCAAVFLEMKQDA